MRLNLLSLFRTLDRLHVAQDLPGELDRLFDLDADLAEALWVLDQPVDRFDVVAMTQDSLASMEAVPQMLVEFLETLPLGDRIRVAETLPSLRRSLSPEEAYNEIPGRDPAVGRAPLYLVEHVVKQPELQCIAESAATAFMDSLEQDHDAELFAKFPRHYRGLD